MRAEVPPEKIARAKELRADGMKWSRISARLGIAEDRLRRLSDERYGERRNARVRAWRRRTGGKLVPVVSDAIPFVPDDTRSLTSRIFGDPLPGRSALDQRGGAV